MTAAELAQGLLNEPLAEVLLQVNRQWVKVSGVRRVQGRHNAVTLVITQSPDRGGGTVPDEPTQK